MTLPPWREEPIARRHDRDAFDCGDAALTEFLRRYARQAHEHGSAKTFVAVPTQDGMRVLGYYTLSPASVAFARTPDVIRRGLGRYDVPAFRLGRLAVASMPWPRRSNARSHIPSSWRIGWFAALASACKPRWHTMV